MTSLNPRRSGNPATRATAGSTHQTASSQESNARSRAVLLRLSRLPPPVVPGVVLVLMLVGLTAPLALAVPSLVVVGGFVSWLGYLSWPVLGARARLLRVVMVGIVAGSAVARVMGWL